MSSDQAPILHVIVVGFHHKKGCQVEFSFPPLVPDCPNECPPGWKYLPTLALPDGSHNFDEDTVYFHLPSLTKPKQTIYGISCFRQIPVEKLKNKTSDITRGTVQKSVCVLSRIPLFGQIQVKMSLITHAYFEEGDFSKISILEDTYHHLNSVLMHSDLKQQLFVDLSARDFVLQWKHKALLLFKLLLLEKRTVFFKSPVHPLCCNILTLVSLFPHMLEDGLEESACVRLSRPMSPMPQLSDDELSPTTIKEFSSLQIKIEKEPIIEKTGESDHDDGVNDISPEIGEELGEPNKMDGQNSSSESVNDNARRESSNSDLVSPDVAHRNMSFLAHLSSETCGFPLYIFTKGFLCLPYLSLPYLDLLTDVNVRGYVVGATNILFKQKHQLYDVLVDVETSKIECQDMELRKLLHLTTEDLRFADYIVKHVAEEKQDVFLDGVGWEGGDEWIRTQFRIYLMCLMRTSLIHDNCIEVNHFNFNFVTAWRETHNYKMWLSGINPGILDVSAGHPFAGQLSVSDMKLRFAHTMQNSESGRKINQAMISTGKAVATTSKAVGGAISQAKGAFSSWWNNLLVSPESIQKDSEETEDLDNSKFEIVNKEHKLSNIVDSNENNRNGVIKTVDMTETKILNENDFHHPGEVHTV
ncbi:late secretory pathway protein AVL9 homolog [Coccinella septempunctata]|uniref:late secretory pathway protein AVL9 homolog n=1 Tax=Coccinella septempunctata TaxID=41139 RepID=UPI001D07F299|nr:late secretory pathway protein AVL9 homolog [Coccinella septempunctata]XP_044755832.1 late secretory pathway protein AVL9 homolog [Coccinella septempunctata]